MDTSTFTGSLNEVFDLLERLNRPLETDPPERWLPALGHLGLGYQADALEHISDVVEAPYLGLKRLFINFIAVRDLSGSLLQ